MSLNLVTDAEVRTTPIGMFHYAHAYAASAIALAKLEIGTTHDGAPVRFLFSHAIELYLKSYLLLKGSTVEELRKSPQGHNLNGLSSKAVRLGLDVPRVHRQSIDALNEVIRDRYIETGARTILLPEVFLQICSNLHKQIGQAVYDASGLTRKPKQLDKLD